MAEDQKFEIEWAESHDLGKFKDSRKRKGGRAVAFYKPEVVLKAVCPVPLETPEEAGVWLSQALEELEARKQPAPAPESEIYVSKKDKKKAEKMKESVKKAAPKQKKSSRSERSKARKRGK